MIIESFKAEDTYAAGFQLGEQAKAGEIFCLLGDLGVGKTVFTQGFAKGLGIEEPICSPTFTIVQEYEEGRIPFYHFDVYRICDIDEMEEIADYLDEKCAALDTLIAKKTALLTELETYKKSLIYEYVTGKKEVPVNE